MILLPIRCVSNWTKKELSRLLKSNEAKYFFALSNHKFRITSDDKIDVIVHVLQECKAEGSKASGHRDALGYASFHELSREITRSGQGGNVKGQWERGYRYRSDKRSARRAEIVFKFFGGLWGNILRVKSNFKGEGERNIFSEIEPGILE